ncbi:MAG: ACT domain-containing protein [Lachnospiraceae bacterium]|nr:ACT domain-containing protein [Lachnospiraceae bacterium]
MKQLSVFVENRAGSLMSVTTAINEAHVNIRAVASFDTPDFAIMRLVVDEPEAAKDYLTSKGFVVRIQDIIGVELEDKQGNLNHMLAVIAEKGINVNYIYSFVIRNGLAPVMVFHAEDYEETVRLLKEAGLRIVDEL